MPTILPTLAALESIDDGLLVVELRLARLRAQVAAVRRVADHAERLVRAADVDGLDGQLAEELARLGCRLLEMAGSRAKALGPQDNAVFRRSFSPTEQRQK